MKHTGLLLILVVLAFVLLTPAPALACAAGSTVDRGGETGNG